MKRRKKICFAIVLHIAMQTTRTCTRMAARANRIVVFESVCDTSTDDQNQLESKLFSSLRESMDKYAHFDRIVYGRSFALWLPIHI